MKFKSLTPAALSYLVIVTSSYGFGGFGGGIIHDPKATVTKLVQMRAELEAFAQNHQSLLKASGLENEILGYSRFLTNTIGDPLDTQNRLQQAAKLTQVLNELPGIEKKEILEKRLSGVTAITRSDAIYGALPTETNGEAIERDEALYRRHALHQRRVDQYELERDFSAGWANDYSQRMIESSRRAESSKTISELYSSKLENSLLEAEGKIVNLRLAVRYSDVEVQSIVNASQNELDELEGESIAFTLKKLRRDKLSSQGFTYNSTRQYDDTYNSPTFTTPSLGVGGDSSVFNDPQTGVELSELGVNFIVEYEVGGRSYYDSNLKTPTYPGGASGVTVGIGYDLRFNNPSTIQRDWSGVIPQEQINALISMSGKQGSKSLANSIGHVSIPYDAAISVFHKTSLPKFSRLTQQVFPTMEQLHPHSQSALVSLVFNRGTSLSGERRREMREIRESILNSRTQEVPNSFRSMARIWQGTGLNGLIKRRRAEADLFQLGINVN